MGHRASGRVIHPIQSRQEGLFSINPFCLELTNANLEFLFLFIKLLLESGGYRMNDYEERELFEAIGNVYHQILRIVAY